MSLGERLGRRVRNLRAARDMTQAELAERSGVWRPNIARFESGRHVPTLPVLARISGALGVSLGRLVDGLEEEPAETPVAAE